MADDGRRPMRVALLGVVVTGGFYLLAAITFLLMIWTLFQLLIWIFTG